MHQNQDWTSCEIHPVKVRRARIPTLSVFRMKTTCSDMNTWTRGCQLTRGFSDDCYRKELTLCGFVFICHVNRVSVFTPKEKKTRTLWNGWLILSGADYAARIVCVSVRVCAFCGGFFPFCWNGGKFSTWSQRNRVKVIHNEKLEERDSLVEERNSQQDPWGRNFQNRSVRSATFRQTTPLVPHGGCLLRSLFAGKLFPDVIRASPMLSVVVLCTLCTACIVFRLAFFFIIKFANVRSETRDFLLLFLKTVTFLPAKIPGERQTIRFVPNSRHSYTNNGRWPTTFCLLELASRKNHTAPAWIDGSTASKFACRSQTSAK